MKSINTKTREEALEEIKRRIPCTDYLQKSQYGGYICPVCGSGTGKHKTGAVKYYKETNTAACHAAANHDGKPLKFDVIDLIQHEYGCDYNGALQIGAERLGIEIDADFHRATAADDFKALDAAGSPQSDEKATGGQNTAAAKEKAHSAQQGATEADYTEYYNLCAARLADPAALSYLQARGISFETAAALWIGYDPAADPAGAPGAMGNEYKPHPTPRIIVPTSPSHYVARRIDDGESFKKLNPKGGSPGILNRRAIEDDSEAVFVTEGAFDALSIMEVGGNAVALNSTSNAGTLLEKLREIQKKQPITTTFIICLDNDDSGRKAAEILRAGMDELNISNITADICNGCNDPNDALIKDRTAFIATIRRVKDHAAAEARAEKEAEKEEYMKASAAGYLDKFRENIHDEARNAFSPTGFPGLDVLLDGGLYAGLYIAGAISSLGKTTFCLQVCDQIAAAGRDVLVFSLEMAKDELIAKSISRHSYIEAMNRHGISKAAKTTRGILTGSRWLHYNADELEVLNAAMAAYSEYAGHIFIHEGVGNIGVEQIRATVEKHIRVTGNRPAVLIDYLQILAPYDIRATDKQNTDKAVLELKRMTRDLSIPVIGISSFNRENYTNPVNMASFKESGAVEYSSDVLLGLQYEGMDWRGVESEKERNKRIRELINDNIANGRAGKPQRIHIKVLKNRNGSKGGAILDFISMFNCFMEAGQTLPGNSAADPDPEEAHQMTADEWVSLSEDEDSPFMDL